MEERAEAILSVLLTADDKSMWCGMHESYDYHGIDGHLGVHCVPAHVLGKWAAAELLGHIAQPTKRTLDALQAGLYYGWADTTYYEWAEKVRWASGNALRRLGRDGLRVLKRVSSEEPATLDGDSPSNIAAIILGWNQ